MFWIRLLLFTLVTLAAFLSLYDSRFLYLEADLGVVFEHDFLAHIFLFSVLSVLASLAWRRSAIVATVLLLFAIGLETAQLWSPSRQPSVSDLAGNVVGVVIGLALVHVARRGRFLLSRKRT